MSALRSLPSTLADPLAPTSTTQLLHNPGIWRARDGGRRALPAQPTGQAALDACLPGNGWPIGLLTEVLLPQLGFGEISLLLPLLAQRSRDGHLLVYVRPPCPPEVSTLARAGIVMERLLLIATPQEREALWAAEQVLASGTPCVVLAWVQRADERAIRRLALAVEGSSSLAIVFRPLLDERQVSSAVMRVRIDGPLSRTPLSLLKARGLACSSADPIRIRCADKALPP
jgi:cell division inhibitor SulA